MLKEKILSVTECESLLIHTSIRNYKKIIVNSIRCLNIEDDDNDIRNEYAIDLTLINDIQKKIIGL